MRLIDADELLKDKVSNAYISRFEIENALTVDAEPVVHAHWIIQYDLGEPCGAICSNCECEISYDRNGLFDTLEARRCSQCGAKMDEEAE